MIVLEDARSPDDRACTRFRPGVGLASRTDDAFLAVVATVLEHHTFTCAGCRFQARRYLEVETIDPTKPATADNLAPVCTFCAGVLRLGHSAENRHGVLIWAKPISQAVLNHIVRACFVGRTHGTSRDGAMVALASLLNLREECKRRIGFSDPGSLNAALTSLDTAGQRDLLRRINGVRFLPLETWIVGGRNIFPKIIADWRTKGGPFSAAPPADWSRLLDIARDGQRSAA